MNLPTGWRLSGPFRSNAGFREALASARDQAARRHHRQIRPAHILAGMLDHADARVVATLAELDIALADLSDAIATGIGRPLPANDHGPDLAYTPRGVAVLQEAVAIAEQLQHDWLGAVHLLAALSHEGWGAAPRVLHAAGAEPRRLWSAVERVAARLPPPLSTEPPLRLPVREPK